MTRNYDVNIVRTDLIKYMDENGISIRAFGEMTDISPSIISRIKSGDYNPGLKMIEKIRAVIGYRVESRYDDFKDWSLVELNDLIERASKERDRRLMIEMYKITIEDLQSQLEKSKAKLKELEG